MRAVGRWFVVLSATALLIALVWGVLSAHTIQTARARALDAWIGVEEQFQHRATLVPSIASALRSSDPRETELVSALENAGASAQALRHRPEAPFEEISFRSFMDTQDALSVELGRALELFNALPDPAAKDRVGAVRAELALSDDRIVVARTDYVAAAVTYNQALTGIPGRWAAAELDAKPMISSFDQRVR